MDNKMQALAKYLEVETSELTEETYDFYGLSVISSGREEYLIGTEEEAQAAAEENIKESLYAFNVDWIINHLDVDFPKEGIRAIQEKYESGNEPLFEIISKLGDWDYFVRDSILADGRGHFLSSYDGEENEIYYENVCYYIYRIN